MKFNWKKRGMVFDASNVELPGGCREFAQSPQAVIFDNFVRIYFSTRERDRDTGKFLSHISFVDMDRNLSEVISVSSNSVIKLGKLGCFDEHGIFPISPLPVGDQLFAYTCGWSRRVSVSVETSVGLAISLDRGETFSNVGDGPVLTSSLNEPILVGDAFVRVYDGVFHMWYIFGTRWIEAQGPEPPARVYKIAQAQSSDGFHWENNIGRQIIEDKLNEDECQALPTVIRIGSRWHMFFCYREATDFRTNPSRSYRIGYAYSDDLSNWCRDDSSAGIEVSEEGWDSEMLCYPHIFECDNKIFLLYNGNEFGRHGFGVAELDI